MPSRNTKSRARVASSAVQSPEIVENKMFEYFPRLPTELRHKIWEYALPEPRLVELAGSVSRTAYKYTVVKSHVNTPAILQACYESRVIGLKHYEILRTQRQSGKPCYIDMNRDTLLIEPPFSGPGVDAELVRDFAKTIKVEQRARIQHLAVSWLALELFLCMTSPCPSCNQWHENILTSKILDFQGLKTLTAVKAKLHGLWLLTTNGEKKLVENPFENVEQRAQLEDRFNVSLVAQVIAMKEVHGDTLNSGGKHILWEDPQLAPKICVKALWTGREKFYE